MFSQSAVPFGTTIRNMRFLVAPYLCQHLVWSILLFVLSCFNFSYPDKQIVVSHGGFTCFSLVTNGTKHLHVLVYHPYIFFVGSNLLSILRNRLFVFLLQYKSSSCILDTEMCFSHIFSESGAWLFLKSLWKSWRF